MKTMRKIASLLLALVMIFGLATTAFADGDNTITISEAKAGETYTIYKLFDLEVDNEEDPKNYSYTVNEDWTAFFGENGAGKTYVTIEDGYVTAISDAAALAKAAATWSGKSPAKDPVTAAGTSVQFTELDNGYWLITSTLGTVAMTDTTPAKDEVTIEEKNPENTITKEVKEDSSSAYGESNDAQIGDTVYFESTVTIRKGTRNVVVHDKMDSGLTYTTGSVAINGLTKDNEYTVNESPADGDTFDVSFDVDKLTFGDAGVVTYKITYSAVLNTDAISNTPEIDPQYNKTNITYGDAQSVEDFTTTTTHKFSVFKHATGSSDNLPGAVFSLKKGGTVVNLIKIDNNNYRVAMTGEDSAVTSFTTVENGNIVIWGVDADSDYTLEETNAPDGYNVLTDEVTIEVEADNSLVADVENKAGTVLPSTGGMGTTLFYVFGGILVVGAIVLLVTKKRMSAE